MTGRDLVVFPLLEGTKGVALEYGFGSGSLLRGMALCPRFSSVIGVEIAPSLIASLAKALDEESRSASSKVTLIQPENDRLPNLATAWVERYCQRGNRRACAKPVRCAR